MDEKMMFDTLLHELTDENYDSLISYVKLWEKGYQFYYVMDADIIGNYCFPVGFDPKKARRKTRNITKEYLADEQVALHTLFYLMDGKEKTVFFDDYIGEVKGMIHAAKAFSSHSNSSKESEFFDDLIYRLSKNPKGESLIQLVKEHFSEIIASILFRIDGLEKLKNLFDSELLIFDSAQFDSPLIENACDIERGSPEMQKRIEEIFIKTDRRFTESKAVDSGVIDRVLSINSFIQKRGDAADKKNIFLYVFDSPWNQAVLDDIKRTFKTDYPLIEGDRINFYRTTQEFFAYLICREYRDGVLDVAHTLKNIRSLKSASRIIKNELKDTKVFLERNANKSSDIGILQNQAYADIFKKYKNIRNAFENTGLLNNFEIIYDSIKENLKDKEVSDVKLLLDEIKKREKSLIQDLVDVRAKMLDELKEEAYFNGMFIRGVETIMENALVYDISKGEDDLIEGTYQHLPIFFKFSQIASTKEHHQYVWRITQIILQQNISDIRGLIFELRELLARLYQTKSYKDNPLEEKIIKVLIFLILPYKSLLSTSQDTETPNNAPLVWLNNITNQGGEFGELESEFLYIKCWLCRRIGDYDTAKKIAISGIERDNTDPRFFHGYFLAEYCIYTTKSNKEEKIKLLKSIIENLTTAYEKYPTFLMQYYKDDNIDLIFSAFYDCFNNNFCFFYTELSILLFSLNNKKEAFLLLIQAEEKLNALKLDNRFRQQFAEYYDTEANLEYAKSFHVKRYDPQVQLLSAEAAIDKAINRSTNRKVQLEYYKLKNKIVNRLNSIASK